MSDFTIDWYRRHLDLARHERDEARARVAELEAALTEARERERAVADGRAMSGDWIRGEHHRAKLAEFERLQQVWLMSPEAAKRLDGYRELAAKCAGLEATADDLRAQLAAAAIDQVRGGQT